MKIKTRGQVLFAMAGAAAGTLGQPFFNGLLRLPQVLYVIAPGLIFALSITIAAMALEHDPANKLRSVKMKWHVLGALVLLVGMPIALVAGAALLTMIGRFMPGDKFQFGGIALSFFLGEMASCVVWSFVLFAWTVLTHRAKARQIMRTAFVATITVMLAADFVEVLSKALWQKSLLSPTISIGEEIASALVLAVGCAGYVESRQAAERV